VSRRRRPSRQPLRYDPAVLMTDNGFAAH